MFDNLKSKKPSEIEEEVLKFWRQNKIFEKSVLKKSPKGDYIFYDGPPFANGLPHYGHILASIIKDVIPRYWTMKGYKVPRRWGWDCHGLPVENEVEKIFQLKAKKDIEKFGVRKFNEEAKKNVLLYADEWKKIIPRIGRWVDMENDYKTMDTNYTESVWWVFKTLYDKGLVYEGYKAMHLCPRCETTLANFEVSQGYKDITDISVVAKFELEDKSDAYAKTYVLAWTTTPWTLPGNAALAVNPKIDYVEVEILNKESGAIEKFILAEARKEAILKDREYKIIKKLKGSDLIGKKYKPLFDYYSSDKNLINEPAGWRIYGADFVSIDEGTGVVHIAPAFGEDDMKFGQKYNLPFIQHVSIDGRFKPEVKDFAGTPVKPKGEHQTADIEIIKWLAGKNKLFSKEKIIHSYPHCWRCETPLLNYASASWFIKVTAIKNKLIANNKKINWVPKHIKAGRFGKWLEEARDWAVSRSRFWGAPLPIWKCEKCDNQKAIGSIEELKKHSIKSGNKYFAMRHGEADHNVKNIASANLKSRHYLTEKGKKEAVAAARKFIGQLKKKKIDLIFSSDFARTKETAELVSDCFGIDRKKIIFDSRLREVNVGIFDGRSANEYHQYFSSLEEKFYKTPPKGENLTQLKNRITEFLYEIDKKYSGKNILIVSHEYTIWNMFAGAIGADVKKAVAMKIDKSDFIKTGEIMPLDFTLLPHNENYELDLHKPYIDEIKLQCECGGNPEGKPSASYGARMKRIAEVFDCWFESGSMPYGQAHYPFAFAQNQKSKIKNQKFGFPAEFIAEGIDQTRGWFYTLLVLSIALFNKPAYKNVIVNGILLAEDGQKMSKRLRNYPDPMDIVNKYGADALRLYLLSSPAVRAENLNFSERGVDEVYKKSILRLWNVFSFYDLYTEKKIKAKKVSSGKYQVSSKNILDKWILARLKQLIFEITKAMEDYELDKAVRPIGDFVDDLSTWYIRRSRSRFKAPFVSHKHVRAIGIKEDADNAIKTTKFVLLELSKVLAPFMPFISEAIFRLLGGEGESAHLENWPAFVKTSAGKPKIIEQMSEVRRICSLGLEARQKAQIKVRQPLNSLKIKNQSASWRTKIKNSKELLDLIKDEINVKEIIFDGKIENDVELDTKITMELKAEGEIRELVRVIQDLRKEAKFTPKNRIILNISIGNYLKNLISKNMDNLKKEIGADKIEFMKTEKFDAKMETKIENNNIWLGIKKV